MQTVVVTVVPVVIGALGSVTPPKLGVASPNPRNNIQDLVEDLSLKDKDCPQG